MIEERIQRERPCHTLFIRNIKASLQAITLWVVFGSHFTLIDCLCYVF